GGTIEKYGVFLDSTSNSARALARSSGEVRRSMTEAASAFAPTAWPLCEIELVGNTAAFHSCASMPGIVEGNCRLPVGTCQVMSPLSFEEADCARPPSGVTAVFSPLVGFSYIFWKSLARCCSASLHFGTPTISM